MTREEIIAALAIRYREVPVRGITLRIRSISGLERAAYDAELTYEFRATPREDVERRKGIAARAKVKLLALSIIDEKGEPIFRSPEEIDAFGRSDSEALETLYAAVDELNALEPETIEALAKNS